MSTCEQQTACDREAALRDLPPSAKLVAKVLEYDGSHTQRQLAEATLLPTRTVRYAIGRLEEADVVEARVSFTDARKRVYSLTDQSPTVE
ncbi:winged helix-turn-helix domain-containing protein [Halomarina oriensis]|uniref:Winged helix-turn-helix transcriptional regulator n=1 Tax=Halomarina oriensis TaxID=671145 RepID=A0A6B0GWC3_9EURY|nr:winged helix-turn-helix domain-containing protein [Halomarina oriensis]MWG36445.1 winged helix-turn-helix transcriptional regulator [Halomarina oriensis]